MSNHRRKAAVAVLVLAALLVSVRSARADSIIVPFVGFNFGGDSGCPSITNCEDKKLNLGVALAGMGNVFGFEEEFAYARDFFGSAPGLESSVLTVMSNVMLIPNVGPVRPYALVGLGLVKTHVSLTPSSLLTTNNNSLGWDVGGGVAVFFGRHAGVRGDIRYFHAFSDLNLLFIPLSSTKLDFGRGTIGFVIRF